MPASTRIDRARRLVVSRARGRLTGQLLFAHQAALSAHADFDPSFSQIYDFRALEGLDLSAPVIDELSRSNPFGGGSRRAFIVDSDVSFGLARMYGALSAESEQTLRVFRSAEDACAWLGVALRDIRWPDAGDADIHVDDPE